MSASLTSSENAALHQVFMEFEKIKTSIQDKRHYVHLFKENFKKQMLAYPKLGQSKLLTAGSTSEGLAVSVDADFDIEIILPFKIDKRINGYKLVELDSGIYSVVQQDNKDADIEGYRKEVFKEVYDVLELVKRNCTSYSLKYPRYDDIHYAAYSIEMVVQQRYSIHMDLVPCVEIIDYKDVPSINQYALRIAEDKVQEAPFVLLTLCPPPGSKYKNAVQVCFPKLEKLSLPSTDVKKAILLTKYVLMKMRNLGNFKLKSFHIKRYGIANYDQLLRRSQRPWEIFHLILTGMADTISKGNGIDGYFLHNHDVSLKQTPVEMRDLAKHISDARGYNPSDILKSLQTA